jgi:hypothetical protein
MFTYLEIISKAALEAFILISAMYLDLLEKKLRKTSIFEISVIKFYREN